LNHDLSTAETIPCGTNGSVLAADHSDRHESRLHKLGIKVKIAAIGGLPVEKTALPVIRIASWACPKNRRFFGPMLWENTMKTGISTFAILTLAISMLAATALSPSAASAQEKLKIGL